MSNLTVLTGGADALDEPDWEALIPDEQRRVVKQLLAQPEDDAPLSNARWRDFARREWQRVTTAMRLAGTLGPENGRQIQRLVIAYVRYERATAEFFRLGLVTRAPRSGVAMVNIIQSEMRQADQDATMAEADLGIPPRRRGAVEPAKKGGKKSTAADAYLGGR